MISNIKEGQKYLIFFDHVSFQKEDFWVKLKLFFFIYNIANLLNTINKGDF